MRYAQHLLELHRRRDNVLLGAGCGDPNWNILLDLLVEEASGRHVSVSSACVASGAPATTALRHLRHLEGSGYVVREQCNSDARRKWVRLTLAGKALLIQALESAMGSMEQH